MNRALVTGITGQDGMYLLERLLAEGAEVHGLVRPGGDTGRILPAVSSESVTLHSCALEDTESLALLVEALAPDEVYSLGGVSSVAYSWSEPVLTGRVSGLAPVAMLEAARLVQERQGKTVRVLQASSAEIFGDSSDVPQTEHSKILPRSPYGAAKAYAQHMVRSYRERGLHASSCILYNHESPRRRTSFVSRKITRSVAEIALGIRDVLVLGNLDARRDWGWAPDYVDAMMRAIRHSVADDFVVATGIAHTVGEFVEVAFDAAGVPDWHSKVATDSSLLRPADSSEQIGDAAKARSVLGWSSSVGFEDVVGRMVAADMEQLASI